MKHQEHFPLNDKEKALLHMEEEKLGQPLKELTGGPAYSMCFACGSDNPIGLHLHFFPFPKAALPSSPLPMNTRATMTACTAASL